MLIGALAGVMGSYYSGSVFVAVLAAIAAGLLLSAVFAYFTISVCADQTVVGIAINIIALGLTTTVNRVTFGMSDSVPTIAVFESVPIPFLSELPVLGPALFCHPFPVYLALAIVPLVSFTLNKTTLGLNIRAVGENPRACDTLGIPVRKVRCGTVLFSGVMAGFAGAFVSLGQLSFFTENMIAGGGFMALAAVVFGNYTPVGVMFAALLFGAGDAIKYRLQASHTGIPTQLLSMLPYLITIVAICAIRRSSNRPASSAMPYKKE